MSCLSTSPPACPVRANCVDSLGCPPNACPDFQIKRHDTRPSFKISVEDENKPLDLTDLVLEANMWYNARLKKAINTTDTVLYFSDNIGFYQALANDIIVVDTTRFPERMRITGFDEDTYAVEVERAVDGTTAQNVKKGTSLRIFRFMNQSAVTEMIYDNIQQVDGTILCNQLIESFLVYEWEANDTCTAGCFWLEFKLLKMQTDPVVVPSVIPQCFSGIGVEWVRRFPVCGEFLIKICDSPTAEI